MIDTTMDKRIPRPFLIGVFVLAMLLGQSLALAHWHAIDAPSSHGCMLCLHAQQGSGALPATPFHPAVTVQHPVAVELPARPPLSSFSSSFLSRAPPAPVATPIQSVDIF